MKTQKEIRNYLKETVSKDLMKRLRPLIITKTYRRKDGNQLCLHLPAFISLDVDDRFEITHNDITTTFKNKKVCVTVWFDTSVAAQITVY